MFFSDNPELTSDIEDIDELLFQIQETDDTSKVGTYQILFRLSFENYQENYVESHEPFYITIIEPCNEINSSLIASVLED